jgi:hypothetical protein
MPFTVLSKGVLCKANFIFEKLTRHNANDCFEFILGYRELKYRVYIYDDYSYIINLPKPVTNSEILIRTVQRVLCEFLSFCKTANRNNIYNREQEIGYYLLITLGIYVLDWDIWYAFFSSPYRRVRLKISESADLCTLFPQFKIVTI